MAREKASRVGGPGKKVSPGYKVKKNNPYQRTILTRDRGNANSSVRTRYVYGNYPDSKPFKDGTIVVKQRKKKKK